MSEDVNKDIKKAMQDAKSDGDSSRFIGAINISKPRILKYSSDKSDVKMPTPTFRMDGKDKNKEN